MNWFILNTAFAAGNVFGTSIIIYLASVGIMPEQNPYWNNGKYFPTLTKNVCTYID